jgi:CRISPR/Cas system-associated exonuclease Cas4 (RecB family)
MEVKRNNLAESDRLAQARAYLNSADRAEGIHVSDLLSPRKAYWGRILPREPTDRETMLYFVGKVQHAMILSDGDLDVERSDAGTRSHLEFGVVYSPDQIGSLGQPIELKTSRAMYPPREDGEGWVRDLGELKEYLRQLAIYCVLEGQDWGQLVVLYLSRKLPDGRSEPTYRVYDVQLNETDKERTREYITRTKADIETAVSTRMEQLTKPCEPWKCFSCRWADVCADASDQAQRTPVVRKPGPRRVA